VAIVPDVDERARPWHPDDVEGYVVGLAEAKLDAVRARLLAEEGPQRGPLVVLAADQVVIAPDGSLCHQQPDVPSATAQLMRLAGTTHHLVNGVVLATLSGRLERIVDRHVVTMTNFGEAEAAAYVETHRPFECAGSYRIEDDAGFVISVEGDDPTGVIGLPMRKVAKMLRRAGVTGVA